MRYNKAERSPLSSGFLGTRASGPHAARRAKTLVYPGCVAPLGHAAAQEEGRGTVPLCPYKRYVSLHLSPPCGSAAHRRNEHTVVPGRAAPSHTLPRVGAWGTPVSLCPCGAGAWGNPVSPHPSPRAYVHVRRSCAWRTTPNEHDLGARAGRPRHGSAGTVTAPSLTLPRWGREPGSSPQRGEAGRGAEPCARWSPQPSMRLRRTRTG